MPVRHLKKKFPNFFEISVNPRGQCTRTFVAGSAVRAAHQRPFLLCLLRRMGHYHWQSIVDCDCVWPTTGNKERTPQELGHLTVELITVWGLGGKLWTQKTNFSYTPFHLNLANGGGYVPRESTSTSEGDTWTTRCVQCCRRHGRQREECRFCTNFDCQLSGGTKQHLGHVREGLDMREVPLSPLLQMPGLCKSHLRPRPHTFGKDCHGPIRDYGRLALCTIFLGMDASILRRHDLVIYWWL